jgi:hypothetical protein
MAFLVTVPTWAGRYAVISGFASTTLAASPAPTEVVGGDPRSPQEGPGLVGNPGGAILVVVAIALLAIVGTTVYVRLTGGPRRGS